MNLLAIDSSSFLSVAVCRGDDIWHAEAEARNCSEAIMGLIDAQMKKSGLAPNDLNGVLCMGGPGSFTGLRVGYSIAKGLALSLSIPFVPIPTLDCIADSASEQTCSALVIPVIEAGKNLFFYALFRDGKRLTPDTEASAGEIAAVIEKNQGARIIQSTNGYAVNLIETAKKRNVFDRDNSAYLFTGPEYIRKTDAELSISH